MRDRGALLLILGDLSAFVAFGAIGMASHEDGVTPKTIARAVLLFPAAWFLIAPWFGAFSQRAIAGQGWGVNPRGMMRVALVWLPAGVIALHRAGGGVGQVAAGGGVSRHATDLVLR